MDSQRPTFFYVFPKGKDFVIREMTDEQASVLYSRVERWIDVGKKTRTEAEELRKALLKK
jgi:hypothetical protein